MAQDMMPLRQSSRTTTSPTTRSSKFSSLQRALRRDGAKQARCGKAHPDKMDKDGAKSVRAPRMARAWHALMIAAATVSTVLACAVPQRVQPHAVAVPVFDHGRGKVFLKETFDKGQTTSSLQHGQPLRDESLRQPHGTEIRLPGKSFPAWHDGRQILQRNVNEAEARSSSGGATKCRESRKGEQDAGGHQIIDRAQRRSSNFACGSDQAGCIHVEITDKMTVDYIEGLCRPVVKDLKMDTKPKVDTGSGSSNQPPAAPKASATPSTARSSQPAADPRASQVNLNLERLQSLFNQQDQKYQTMLNQVMQQMMAMQGQHPQQFNMADSPMEEELTQVRGWTQEEIDQINADYWEEHNRDRFEAQHGEFSSVDCLGMLK